MKFEYQAIDEDGGIIRGIIEAQTPQRVLQILLHKQLHPIDIRNLTDTTVEISRLHQLKQKLTGKTDIIEEQPSVEKFSKPKKAVQFDWIYIMFLLLVGGLVAAATFLQ